MRAHAADPDGPTPYAYYIVLLLMAAYTLSFVDRILVSLLVAPLRTEFGIGDAGMGVLVGFGFVLFYSLMGLPFGAAADTRNRRSMIVQGMIGWSIATMMCGLAGSFAALLMARALVGVGEATLSPAAYSTISDRFSARHRGFAISLYSLGVSLGGGLAMGFGGVLVDWANSAAWTLPVIGPVAGWRLAFLVVGGLGLPLALLVRLTMTEAKRSSVAPSGSFAPLFAQMRARPTAFGAVIGGYAVLVIASYIPLLWAPAYFARVHAMSAAQIGTAFGLTIGVLGSAGLVLGGLWADRRARNGQIDAPVQIVRASCLIQAPFMLAAYLVADTGVALGCFAVGMMAVSMIGGLQATTLQLLVPAHLRGRLSAFYLLCVNLTGMGIGPLAVGLLSDALVDHANGLGLALAIITGSAVTGAALILWLARDVIRAAMLAPEC